MFKLDLTSPLPIYAQLEREIKLALVAGAIKPGEQMPTVRELAVRLKINANTVARVYTELERQKLLETRRGIGTFVSEVRTNQTLNRTKKTRAELLDELVDDFINQVADNGYSPAEIIEAVNRLSANKRNKKL